MGNCKGWVNGHGNMVTVCLCLCVCVCVRACVSVHIPASRRVSQFPWPLLWEGRQNPERKVLYNSYKGVIKGITLDFLFFSFGGLSFLGIPVSILSSGNSPYMSCGFIWPAFAIWKSIKISSGMRTFSITVPYTHSFSLKEVSSKKEDNLQELTCLFTPVKKKGI